METNEDYLLEKISILEEQLDQYDDLTTKISNLIHSDRYIAPENEVLLKDLKKIMGAWI